VGEELQVAGKPALGFAEALGEALDFAQVGGIEGEDAVRLAQLRLLDDDGFGLIVTRFGHNRLPIICLLLNGGFNRISAS